MAQLTFQRGDIHWVEFPKKTGGKKIHTIQEEHPALIISNNQQNQFSSVITVLPITSQLDKIYPFEVLTNIKDKKGKVLLDQITTIDKEFIGKKISFLTEKEMAVVERKLHITLSFSCYQNRQ